MVYIEMKHSYKRYKTGDVEIIANNDITFEIEKGVSDYTSVLLGQENQLFSIFLVVWIPMMKERSSSMGKTSPIIMLNN